MLFSYVSGQQQIGNSKKCRQTAGDFDCHADAAVRHGAHRPIEHIQGFTRSHWMPSSGKCQRSIVPAAVMVDGFIETTLNTNKTQLLPSTYGTFWALVVCENFVPQNGPSTQLIDATSCIKMWDATTIAEELANISSYQTLWGDKNWNVIKRSWSSIYKLVHKCATSGKAVKRQCTYMGFNNVELIYYQWFSWASRIVCVLRIAGQASCFYASAGTGWQVMALINASH